MGGIARRTMMLGAGALVLAPSTGRADERLRISVLNREEEGVTSLARSLADTKVATYGFMAPPLKAQSRFFVLATQPLSVCPFCEAAAEWPSDILAVFAKRIVEVVPFWQMIEVDGTLRVGEHVDPETGFLSMLRLENATFRSANG
jgi:hypothetical protein